MPDGPTSQPSPEAIAAEYHGRPIDVFSCVSRGWNLVLENPAPLVGGTLLIFCAFIVLQFVPLLGWLATIVLQGPLFAGLYQVFIRRIRGENVSIWDAFTGVGEANFLQLFLAGFISSLLTSIGL